ALQLLQVGAEDIEEPDQPRPSAQAGWQGGAAAPRLPGGRWRRGPLPGKSLVAAAPGTTGGTERGCHATLVIAGAQLVSIGAPFKAQLYLGNHVLGHPGTKAFMSSAAFARAVSSESPSALAPNTRKQATCRASGCRPAKPRIRACSDGSN